MFFFAKKFMDGLNKEDLHQPRTPPTTRPSSPKMYDTPQKPAEHAAYNDSPPRPLNSMGNDDARAKEDTNKSSPQKGSSRCFFSCINSDGGLKLLAEAADYTKLDTLVKAAEPYTISTFANQCEAMKFCLRIPTDDSCRIGVRKRTRETTGSPVFDVYSTLPRKNFRKEDFPDLHLVKAYAPSIVSKYASKNPFLLVDLETPGIEHVVHPKGTIRESYKLPDQKKLRLYHHTCTYLSDPTPCINCQHPEYHARCLAGEEFYAIMDK